MYNVVSTRAPSFLIGSYSFLQVTRTAIKAWMGLKISKIERGSMELAALEDLKKSPYTCNGSNVVSTLMLSFLDGSSSFLQGQLFFILVGNQDIHKSMDEFEFGQISSLTMELSALASEKYSFTRFPPQVLFRSF